MNARHAFVVALLMLAIPSSAGAQHLYFDTDGDGVHSDSDFLNPAGETVVAVYLDTCHGVEGAFESCNAYSKASASGVLDIFSYNLILTVEPRSGSLRWGKYVDAVGFSEAQDKSSPTELLVSRRGTEALSPGRYLLGKVSVTTLAGSPVLRIATSSKLDPSAFTGFGTHCGASDYPNTYVLGTDWSDGGSVRTSEALQYSTSLKVQSALRGSSNSNTVFALTLAASGRLRLAIYDVQGRLVRTLLNTVNGPAGALSVTWDGRGRSGEMAASGVYFARLDAGATRLNQRFVRVR